jgi:hypothetical protein
MQNDHIKACDCYDCIENNSTINHADTFKPSDFFGASLRSMTHSVNVYSNTAGLKLATIPTGHVIGTIYSYVQDKQGNLWWMLEKNTRYKKPQFVKHMPGVFDFKYAERTVKAVRDKEQAEVNKKVEKRLADNAKNNALYNLGKNPLDSITGFFGEFKMIIILIIVAIIAFAIMKMYKS